MIHQLVGSLIDRRRLQRFVSVGLVGAGIDLAISMSLVLSTDIPPELAKLIGAEVAIVVMFLVNDRWTFADVGTWGWIHGIRRFLKSNLVRGGGLFVQVLVVFLLVRTGVVVVVWETDVWAALTMPIAIACGFLANYAGETLYTWRAYREHVRR